MRSEFKSVTERDDVVDLPLLEKLRKSVVLETVGKLDYLNWVILEALRVQAPANASSHFEFTQDTKVCGLNCRKGDELQINIHALHYNEEEW